MEEIKIKKNNLQAAYKVADEKTKMVLDALFGVENPDYSDYRNIKTYEDACAALGISPITDFGNDEQDEMAYKKLKTISRALWGKDFEPIPDAEGSRVYYYPWQALYTQKEIDRMDADDRGSLLSARAGVGASAGFGYLRTNARSSHSSASIGFRLCQETAEKAKYFGRQFIRIWADYLKFNFEIKED